MTTQQDSPAGAKDTQLSNHTNGTIPNHISKPALINGRCNGKIPQKDTSTTTVTDSQCNSIASELDGGWGWVIVIASMIMSVIADGIPYSFGLLYIEFLKEFGASKSKTAWIGSLFLSVPLLAGAVISALVDRYGCRTVTILGGLVSGFGFIISAFIRSIELMYFTFGILTGLGLGVCYITAVVSITHWFDKRKTLALGLGACGTGIGTFVYAPITQYFIEEYGWRGTTLILAATFFNICVCGLVMRPPPSRTIHHSKAIADAYVSMKIDGNEEKRSGMKDIKKMIKNGVKPERILTVIRKSSSSELQLIKKDQVQSAGHLPSLCEGSVLSMQFKATSCPNFQHEAICLMSKAYGKKWRSSMLQLLKEMMDFSLFLELHFFLLATSTIVLFVWCILPYFYLAEHLIHNGYTESEASMLISVIGITNTVGMVALGWAGDQPWMNIMKTYIWSLVICGISIMAIIAFTDCHVLLALSCGIFGLSFASNCSFTPVILAKLVTAEQFTTGYGLIMVCQGIGHLIGPPLSGLIFDFTETWDLSFFVGGCFIIAAAVLVSIIPNTYNRKLFGKTHVENDFI